MNQQELLNQLQAQQQAVFQNAQHIQYASVALSLGIFIVGLIVLHMFYARLRDIANELRLIRITFEESLKRKASPAPLPSISDRGSDDSRYMPKS